MKAAKLVQREFAGTESKSETEAMLRKAMEDYEEKKFVAKSENANRGRAAGYVGGGRTEARQSEQRHGDRLSGTQSDASSKYPIGEPKAEEASPRIICRAYLDLLSLRRDEWPDGTMRKAAQQRLYAAILRCAARSVPLCGVPEAATYPSIPCSMSCMREEDRRTMNCFRTTERMRMFQLSRRSTYEQFLDLNEMLSQKEDNPALLPIQIAYYTGLRIGEVCSLTWQDIDLEGAVPHGATQYAIQRRKAQDGDWQPPSARKIRTVDFCDTLAEILQEAKTEQHKNRFRYGDAIQPQLTTVRSRKRDRTYYEVYSLPRCGASSRRLQGNHPLSACDRTAAYEVAEHGWHYVQDGEAERVDGLEGFHFHQLRHTFTSNLLS